MTNDNLCVCFNLLVFQGEQGITYIRHLPRTIEMASEDKPTRTGLRIYLVAPRAILILGCESYDGARG